MSGRNSFLKYVVPLSLLILVAGLAVAEGIARKATSLEGDIGKWHEAREAFRMVPFLETGYPPYDPESIEKSFYFGEQSEASWKQKLDCIIVGGSTAAGAMATTYENTFFRVASRKTGLNIVSVGAPGYVGGQELNMLALHLLPRVRARNNNIRSILLLSGFNDMVLSPVSGIEPGYPANWQLVELLMDNPQHSFLVWLGKKSALATLYVQSRLVREDDLKASSEKAKLRLESSSEDFKARLRAWETNLRAMAACCRGAYVELAYVAQPNGFMVDSKFKHYKDKLHIKKNVKEVWPAFTNYANEICEQEGVHFVDASLAVSPEHFGDPAHFDDEGHEQLADFLIDNYFSAR